MGAVVAANRLQKFLVTGQKTRLDEAAISHGGQLPDEEGVADALSQDKAGVISPGEAKSSPQDWEGTRHGRTRDM